MAGDSGEDWEVEIGEEVRICIKKKAFIYALHILLCDTSAGRGELLERSEPEDSTALFGGFVFGTWFPLHI